MMANLSEFLQNPVTMTIAAAGFVLVFISATRF